MADDTLHDIDDLVERGELVTVVEIAEMAGVDEETARAWTEEEGFPQPEAEPETGALWSRGAVDQWLMENREDHYQPPTI